MGTGRGRCHLLTSPVSPPSMCVSPYPPQGVVPYLGTFLRDLVMLDAAMKDELEVGVTCPQGGGGGGCPQVVCGGLSLS